jgi:hypothetical protein
LFVGFAIGVGLGILIPQAIFQILMLIVLIIVATFSHYLMSGEGEKFYCSGRSSPSWLKIAIDRINKVSTKIAFVIIYCVVLLMVSFG